MWKRLLRKPLVWAVVVVSGAVGVFGLYWFQPWKLVTDTRVEEALPVVAVPAGPTPTAPTGADPTASAQVGPRLLAAGTFITHEHETTGTGQVIRLPNGRHQLVLRDLNTSNGPDLRVWLTDRPVVAGTAGWRVFDDGRWVELAKLKGNKGDQVYDIPASVEPAQFRSVSIWCRRFAVSFGAAELRAA